MDLPAAAEKHDSGFSLDIKGRKINESEERSAAASFQGQAGGLSCSHHF